MSYLPPESDLIDTIYGAALSPEQWPGVLSTMARFAGADGAMMMHAERGALFWEASAELREHTAAYFEGGWHKRTSRTHRLLRHNHAGFLRDIDTMTLGELEEDPVQRDFLRPRGLGRELGTTLPVPSGDLIVITTHRAWDKGPVPPETIERMDMLRPHLARAALLSGRLWIDRGTSAVQAFQAMGLAAAAVSWDGKVIASNSLFSHEKRIVAASGNRIGLREAGARALFDNALAGLRAGRSTVLSILLADAEHAATVLHLVPLRGPGRDLFAGGLSLVILTSMAPHALPSADMLNALFDLTPAEARLARGLAGGRSLPDLAEAVGLSRETLRTQLKSVLLKTGAPRQVDLVRMLSHLPPEG